MNLKNWSAKRAGGRITIVGVEIETGDPKKIVGVDCITPVEVVEAPLNLVCLALDKDGVYHGLAGRHG